ncbi:MAG: DUF2244 domain-containing protein [Polaromonas sp.]
MMSHVVSRVLHRDMGQANTEDGMSESAGVFVFRSCPNHSLTHRQQQRVFWSLAATCFVSASGLTLLGYWPILPFAGLEIGLLAWAWGHLRSREGNYETLTIEGDVIVLEWQAGSSGERREMNRQWARVICDCGAPGRNCRLSLRSHGRETIVGQYLSDEARLQLAETLRRKLQA